MLDIDKFIKYSKPGPRYTSYPTANEFVDIKEQDILKVMGEDKQPLSIYVHLPFCQAPCYFCGCSSIYGENKESRAGYIDYLKKELNLLKKHMDTTTVVEQFHFGGGTPTYYTDKELDEIIKAIKNVFTNFSESAEVSCEVDPRFFNKKQMDVLKKHGFNRVSFGVQDLNDDVQKAINRIQPYEKIKKVMDIAREGGVKGVNVDLIYGLPLQTKESFLNTLEKVVSLKPDRIVTFNFAYLPWLKKHIRDNIKEEDLPTLKEKLNIFKEAIDFLTKANYKMIGMDHFAKEEDELFKAIDSGTLRRNFQGYTIKKETRTIGIGLTSIGEGHKYYVQNKKDLADYMSDLDSGRLPITKGMILDDDDVLRKHVIMTLMCNFRIDYKKVNDKFGIDFKTYFADSLEKIKEFEDLNLLKISDSSIEINDSGAMLVRNIVMPFDRYLKDESNRFSKTI